MHHRTPGGRTAEDLVNEYVSALKTCAERKRRMPATVEGMAYTVTMDAIAASLAVCVQPGNPTALVTEPAELDAAEAALIAARAALYPDGTAAEFLALDIMQARMAPREPVAQIVTVGAAPRIPQANGAEPQ
jgi:hypothetical protein